MNNKQRLQIHQDILHKIHMCHISMNSERLQKIMGLICAYGFAVNANNGTESEAWVKKHQDFILNKLGEI